MAFLKKGFTLIELVIVIVILGILVLTAVSRYIDISKEAKDNSEEAVIGAIKEAIAIECVQNIIDGNISFPDDNPFELLSAAPPYKAYDGPVPEGTYWRYVDVPNADYTIYVAEEENEICGYIILGCRKEDSLTWGYIYDIIVLTGRADIIQCLIAKAVEYFSAKEADAIFCKMVADKVYRKEFLKMGFIPYFRVKGRFIDYNASKEISDEFIKNPNNWFIQQGDLPGVY